MEKTTNSGPRQMILVLGMHRSGTSAVTGMLSHLGADPGDHLVASAEDNPKGFFEHEDIWALDHELLQAVGSDWDDPAPLPPDWTDSPAALKATARMRTTLRRDFSSTRLALIKDPRMCRLMPLWREVLQAEDFTLKVVLVVRAPSEVAASLTKRDGLYTAEAAGMWLRYQLEAEAATRGDARLVVPYKAVLRDWRAQAQRIADALEIDWPRTPDEVAAQLDAFIEPGLRHHHGAQDAAASGGALQPPVTEWLQSVHAALTDGDSIDTGRMDDVAQRIAQVDEKSAIYIQSLRHLRTKGHQLKRELDEQYSEGREMAAGNERLEQQVRDYADERERMAAGNSRLEQQVRDYSAEHERMVAGNAHLEKQVREYAAERERMAAGNERLQQQVREYAEERERMAAGNAWLEQQVQTYAADQKTLLEDKQWLEGELKQRSDERAWEQGQRELLQHELAAVYASRSWRVTRPLRAAVRRLQRLRTGHAAAPPPAATVEAGPGAAAPEAPAAPPPEHAEKTLRTTFAQATGRRILIATPDIVGPIRNGGIGTAFYALARTLVDAGHAVTLLYTLGDHCEGDTDIAHWERHYAALGIRFVPLRREDDEPKLDAPWYYWHAYRLYLWMKKRQEQFDIAYFPEWKGEAYYALQAKRLGLDFEHLAMAVVTHSPTAWAESGNYLLPPQLAELDLDFMEQRVVEMADVVVSPSRYMLDWMRQCGWTITAPTHVVQNLMIGAAAQGSVEAPSIVVHEWVFFGRLELRKGLRIFLEALARVPVEQRGWHTITFMGKATKTEQFDPLALIHEKMADWPQPPNIISDYDRDQALAYLKKPGRLAIIASLVENSPYTVLECLLSRIPFIAADVGGIAELVHPEDRQRSLFKPNPGALVATLTALDGTTYTLPRPAVTADQTREQWLAMQERLYARAQQDFEAPERAPPRITVCLVHYDRPHMLARAVKSLREQTYTDFDVVLVDDGSPSARAHRYLDELEEDFARRGWSIVRQDNAYLGAARNAAAAHARGEYIMFMDDDNIAKPHELATFARAARHADADILTTVSDVFSDAAGGEVPETSRELWIPLGNAPGLGVFRNVFGDANALIRRSVFQKAGGFTEDYGIGHEDWEFFARATLAGASLYLVPEPLFWYRVDPGSMLRSGQSQTDHARSVRAYWQALPGSVGAALAFALKMQRQPPKAPAVAGPRPGLYARFVTLRRQAGWRVAIRRAVQYLGRG